MCDFVVFHYDGYQNVRDVYVPPLYPYSHAGFFAVSSARAYQFS